MLAVFALLGLSFGTWLSRLPAVRDHLEASTLDMSVYGLCLAFGSLVGLAFSGRTVAWLGARRTLFFCLLLQAFGLVLAIQLFWFSGAVWGMALLFVYGFAFSTSDVAVNVSGAEAERALGRPRMPMYHGAYSLGAVATMGLGSAAEAAHVPPPIHVTVVLVLVAAAGLVALRQIPHDRGAMPRYGSAPAASPLAETAGSVITGPVPVIGSPGPGTVRSARARGYSPWRDPRIYLVGLVALGMSLAEGTGSDWVSLALVDGRGFSNSLATLTVAVFFAAMVLTRFAGSPLLERFGRVAVLRGSALTCALGVVIVILVPAPWASVLGTTLWGAGCALGFPVGVSAAADDPATAVKSVAAVSAIAYGAYLIGPAMIGFIGQHFSLLTAFWPVAAFMLLCLSIAGAARKPGATDG